MKMKQREILNAIALDFARDRQEQDEYLNAKIEQIKRPTKEYLMSTGMKGFMLGLSGGIDSFVAAALVADAVRDISGLVHLLILPNGEQKDIGDARGVRRCAHCALFQYHLRNDKYQAYV